MNCVLHSKKQLRLASCNLRLPGRCKLQAAGLSKLSEIRVLSTRKIGIAVAMSPFHVKSLSGDNGEMADVMFIVITVVFFIIAWLYVIACDKL